MIVMKKMAPAMLGFLAVISGVSEAGSADYQGRVPVTDYRGDWSASLKYFRGQVVVYQDQAWIALRNRINSTVSKTNPPSGANNDWALFAAGTTTVINNNVTNTSGSGTSGGLQASDGGGHVLGTVVSASSRSLTVYEDLTKTYARLEVNPHDPNLLITSMWGTDNYVYTTPDCTGTPLRVFSEVGDGSVVPNDLNGYSLFGPLSYAEALVKPGGDRIPTGKYVTLGKQLSKIVNPSLADVTVASDVTTVGSVKTGFQCVQWDLNDQRCVAYSDAQDKQCLKLDVNAAPAEPERGAYSAALKGTAWIYKGKSLSQDAAFSAYQSDRVAWRYYLQHNIIPPNHVRWVYTYDDGTAPFPFDVTQPLSYK